MLKELKNSTIAITIIMLILGLLLLIKPGASLMIICYVIALSLFIIAVTRLIEYLRLKQESCNKSIANLVFAIIFVLAALFLVIRPASIAMIIPTILGIIVLIDGVSMIISAVAYSSYLPNRGVLTIAFGILLVILGLYSITHSFGVQVVLMRFLGASLVITSLFNVYNQFSLERANSKKTKSKNVDFETYKGDKDK